ncbi:unnamed protein product [Calicophoron daubneyi]|uniref:RxLR effector protein n=1 Tax=Calicophoron daubneyi TaxID=300641 RepID=A0AAV2TPV3_CALDB
MRPLICIAVISFTLILRTCVTDEATVPGNSSSAINKDFSNRMDSKAEVVVDKANGGNETKKEANSGNWFSRMGNKLADWFQKLWSRAKNEPAVVSLSDEHNGDKLMIHDAQNETYRV